MQMEIDFPPPSMGHRTACKRARSPDDMGSPSRSTKRYIISTQDERRPTYPIFLSCGSGTAGGGQCASEDWVQRASELTIETAHGGGFDARNTTAHPESSTSASVTNTSRPQLTPLRTSFDYKQTIQPNDSHLRMETNYLNSLPSSTSQGGPLPHSTLYPPELPPAINVLPPTPDVIVHAGFTRPSSPISDTSMSISNSPVTAVSSPSRRQRFTMGPRADCEKCRLGVKGHSVHLD
ncbi:hypothetical protein WG66_007061 [Moniliophthora roreri]|uniref:Uncharacterized protein n=1 Tax=Moniliophthora roreri TaxID=221103 RepID=A0A0W0F8V9_MONRR|nr:hypothetical protein WG66_007061 [Moniliophthora roreri]